LLPHGARAPGGAIIVSLSSIVRQSPNIVSRNIAGEAVLVPIARTAEEVDSIYTLNETASTIWDALDGRKTLSEILDLVVAEYEVTREQAELDLYDLVAQLGEVRAVVVEGGA